MIKTQENAEKNVLMDTKSKFMRTIYMYVKKSAKMAQYLLMVNALLIKIKKRVKSVYGLELVSLLGL